MHIKDTFPELYQIRKRPVSIEGVRAKLQAKRGREYWQSLEELSGTEEFEELLHQEFPQHASEWDDSTDRRTFIKLMGASLALAGLTGCSYQPPESIVPYVRQPEDIVPGKSQYLFVYPFVKTREWYSRPAEQRQEMMDEHIRIGSKYRSVKLHTTYSFGLDDQEFVVAFETDYPSDFLDLVQELRETKASSFTLRATSSFTRLGGGAWET